MAKIKRALKFWSETSGRSEHIGIEVDTMDDLHMTIRKGHEIEDLRNAILVAGQILNSAVAKKEKPAE